MINRGGFRESTLGAEATSPALSPEGQKIVYKMVLIMIFAILFEKSPLFILCPLAAFMVSAAPELKPWQGLEKLSNVLKTYKQVYYSLHSPSLLLQYIWQACHTWSTTLNKIFCVINKILHPFTSSLCQVIVFVTASFAKGHRFY